MDGLDIVVDLTSMTLLLLLIIYTYLHYPELSDQIPTHYNAAGKVDQYGSKLKIWLLPGIGFIALLSMAILNRYPQLHNHNVKITEQNAYKYYRFSTRLVRFSSLFVIIVFSIIQYITIQKGIGNAAELGAWFLPYILIAGIGFTVISVIYKYKLKNS